MKNTILFLFIIASVGILFSSCKKNYSCQCSYQNQVKLTRDLGFKTKSDAEKACSAYDTTVTGEKWKCVLN